MKYCVWPRAMDHGEPQAEETSLDRKRKHVTFPVPRKSLLMYFFKYMISNHFGTSVSLGKFNDLRFFLNNNNRLHKNGTSLYTESSWAVTVVL